MSRDLNKVMLIGRLGADPEMRYTASGTAVTNFRVACTRRRRGGQEGDVREETDWFTVVAWEKLAEITSSYLTKGSKVYVEGVCKRVLGTIRVARSATLQRLLRTT